MHIVRIMLVAASSHYSAPAQSGPRAGDAQG